MKRQSKETPASVLIVTPRGDVIVDTACGAARLAAERARVAALLARAVPPASCGSEIPVAPARGPQIAFTPRETVMTANGPRVRASGHCGAQAVRVGDAFDVMHEQARRAHRSKDGKPFVAPFTPAQIAAGRDYAALCERVAASGLRCSSFGAQGAGGSGGSGVSEAVSHDLRRLAALRRRIGTGIAKDAVRPSRGGQRGAISVRRLVDQVCIGGLTVSQAAEAHGWLANGRMRAMLRAALAAALDRMQGYDLACPQNIA